MKILKKEGQCLMSHIYTVRQVNIITSEEMKKIVEDTAKVFENDKPFRQLFPKSDELKIYLKASISYSLKTNIVHVCYDANGICCGIAIWKNCLTKSKQKLLSLMKFLASIPINSLGRMFEMAKVTKAYHYSKPHYYLALIASFENGAGSALMEYAIGRYGMEDIYLENSKPEQNYHFYYKWGFETLRTIEAEGQDIMLMLRKGKTSVVRAKTTDV